MKVLIPSYTGLGNFILKTPFISSLKMIYPNIEIDIVCGLPYGVENVLSKSNLIKKTYWLPTESSFIERVSFFRKLKKKKYTYIFIPFDSCPPFFLFYSFIFLRTSILVGHINLHQKRFKSWLYELSKYIFFSNHKWTATIIGRHEIDLNLDLLSLILKKPYVYNKNTIVCWEKLKLLPFEIPKKFIVVQPSAKNGLPSPKTWNPKNFIKLIKTFSSNYPEYKIIVVGDKGENVIDSKIKDLNNKIIDITGKTDFNQLCNILYKSRLTICHDSGIMHIANALKRPLIALYGPTDFSRTMPLYKSSRVIFSKNKCFSKMYGFQFSENELNKKYPDYYCLSGITINQVMNEVKKILN